MTDVSSTKGLPIKQLMVTVAEMGGAQKVTESDLWGEVAKKIGTPNSVDIKQLYEQQVQKTNQDDNSDSEPEFEVEKILDDKKKGKQTHFFIKWKGFPESENSWEPEANLSNCVGIIKAYREAKNKTKHVDNTAEPAPPKIKTAELVSATAVIDPNATFATDIAESVIGACLTPTGINLIVKWKGEAERYSWIHSAECRKHIPDLMLDFYEARIKFVGAQ
eukprot:c12352_g1_i1.p1 GENE.c12352_g1_i1~~c12352_g1_i1.p1  ORF type:complete len:251 (-),score=77.32 c12352_g1_i1:1137-1796(-)